MACNMHSPHEGIEGNGHSEVRHSTPNQLIQMIVIKLIYMYIYNHMVVVLFRMAAYCIIFGSVAVLLMLGSVAVLGKMPG